jgi:hypothetical protein
VVDVLYVRQKTKRNPDVINPETIKSESIARLREWGFPVIEHLPTLETPDELSPPNAQSVARRCMVMSHVIGIGFGGSASELYAALGRWELLPYASDEEVRLLTSQTHTDQEKINLTWQTECMQSFAWCLGLSELDCFRHCDDDLASRFPDPFADPSGFIATASLRPFDEIYRMADLHYRLHWAARQSRLMAGDFPISEGFVRERRKALDWVIGVEPDWDEVPSDT